MLQNQWFQSLYLSPPLENTNQQGRHVWKSNVDGVASELVFCAHEDALRAATRRATHPVGGVSSMYLDLRAKHD
eukprot:362975-Amphidinium_carterae.1